MNPAFFRLQLSLTHRITTVTLRKAIDRGYSPRRIKHHGSRTDHFRPSATARLHPARAQARAPAVSLRTTTRNLCDAPSKPVTGIRRRCMHIVSSLISGAARESSRGLSVLVSLVVVKAHALQRRLALRCALESLLDERKAPLLHHVHLAVEAARVIARRRRSRSRQAGAMWSRRRRMRAAARRSPC